MTFVLHPLFHYDSIIEPRARFLLSLLKDLSIDFPSHFILSLINVYKDTTTCNKFIFPLAITRILHHLFVPLLNSPFFAIIGALKTMSVQRNEAQLWPKQPQTETTTPPAPSVPSSFAPSYSSAGVVTLEIAMAQLQRMDACLDTLTVSSEHPCWSYHTMTGSPWWLHSISFSFSKGFRGHGRWWWLRWSWWGWGWGC